MYGVKKKKKGGGGVLKKSNFFINIIVWVFVTTIQSHELHSVCRERLVYF